MVPSFHPQKSLGSDFESSNTHESVVGCSIGPKGTTRLSEQSAKWRLIPSSSTLILWTHSTLSAFIMTPVVYLFGSMRAGCNAWDGYQNVLLTILHPYSSEISERTTNLKTSEHTAEIIPHPPIIILPLESIIRSSVGRRPKTLGFLQCVLLQPEHHQRQGYCAVLLAQNCIHVGGIHGIEKLAY